MSISVFRTEHKDACHRTLRHQPQKHDHRNRINGAERMSKTKQQHKQDEGKKNSKSSRKKNTPALALGVTEGQISVFCPEE